MFRVYGHLYPFENIIRFGLFLREEMPLNGHLGEVGLLIQPCPQKLSLFRYGMI